MTSWKAAPAMTAAWLLGLAAANAQDAKVDELVRDHMAKRHVPGLSLAVVRDGKVVHARGYGLANLELSAPAAADTVYELASLTKPFTAAAVLMLVEDGKLGLDDEVAGRLPGLPAAWRGVRVRHLLTLTSGIPEYWGAPGFSQRKDYTHSELIALAAGRAPAFRPGERWDYSNTNYVLLGMLIEKAGGEPYGDFLARRIFRPLGMDSTRVNDPLAVIPRRAAGYERGFGRWALRDFVSPTLAANGDGALLSTAADLVKWDAALGGRLLKGSSWRQAWTPAALNDGGRAGYGFGWHVGEVRGHKAAWHSGGNPGYECHLARFPDDRLTVVILCNTFPASTERLARAVAGRYVPGLAEPEEAPAADADPATTRRLREALSAALDGAGKPALFDAEQRAKLRSFGPLRDFTLLSRKGAGETRVHRYRVTLGDTTLIFGLQIKPGGDVEVTGVEFP
jgi:CubicO group peptidase (beta-lactamase class C family)